MGKILSYPANTSPDPTFSFIGADPDAPTVTQIVSAGTLNAPVYPSGDTSGATDTARIQAAENAAAGNGIGALVFTAGPYYVTNLVKQSNVSWFGAGRGPTVFNLADGQNTPILTSYDFSSLTGSGSNTAGVTGFVISGMVFDGNQSGQTTAAEAAVQIFGFDYDLVNVSIRNFLATDGLYTEFGLGGQPGPEGAMESRFQRMRIHGNTLSGSAWHNRGPHDSLVSDMILYQNTVNANGYFAETGTLWSGSACLIERSHIWGTHNIAWNLAAPAYLVNCVGEGATSEQVLATAPCSWTSGDVFPSTTNGAGFVFGTTDTACDGFILSGVQLSGFAGGSTATAAINAVNTASGRYDAVFATSGTAQQVYGTFQVSEPFRFTWPSGPDWVPSAAALAGLGTSPPAPVMADASDNYGIVKLGTGTSPTAGEAVTVTWAQPKPGDPSVLISAGNAATAALEPYILNVGSTSFTVGFAVAPTASEASGTYQFSYADVRG